MPIANVSEFEAVVGQVVLKLEKALVQLGDRPAIKDAKRVLEKLEESARNAEETKAMRKRVGEVAETLRTELSKDDALRDDMWDVLDFIDYCM